MGNRYECLERTDGGISHDPGTLSRVDKPGLPHLPKSDPDSGSKNTRGQSSPHCTKAHCDQFGEMRNQTSGGGRCEGLTNASKDPEGDLRMKPLRCTTQVGVAFHQCKKSPMGHDYARSCAELLALTMPDDILPVFVQTCQTRMGLR